MKRKRPSPSSLDSLEAITRQRNSELGLRLRSLGLRQLARQVESCCVRRCIGPNGEERLLHCRKHVCATCRGLFAQERQRDYVNRIEEMPGPIWACMLTLTEKATADPLRVAGLRVHRALRAFTQSSRWRLMTRKDPSLGILTGFEIGEGESRPAHPHGHALLVSLRPGGATTLAEAMQDHWLRQHPSASPAAQERSAETSVPDQIAGLVWYPAKGTQLDLGWPDAVFEDAVTLLTSGYHLVTGSGSLRGSANARKKK